MPGTPAARFDIFILSDYFFAKDWPQSELDGLFARETAERKVILPVWHKVTKDVVLKYSSMLAGKMASNTEKGVKAVAQEVFMGNTAQVFFSAMQVFFHGTNLLTSDLDRELLYATDNLLRVISAPHLHVEYRAGKCATAARSLGTFCKRRGLDPMLDPSEGAEELIHQFRLLHASLLDLAQALPVAAASDQPLLRLLIALLKYAQFQSPKQPFPLTGGTLHQAIRTILARAVTAHLKVKLPDPLDDIELGAIRSYCHAIWKEVETEESPP